MRCQCLRIIEIALFTCGQSHARRWPEASRAAARSSGRCSVGNSGRAGAGGSVGYDDDRGK